MGRTTFAGLGIAAALLAGAPAWASSMVDISGALATDSAASSSSGLGAASALKSVKGALQKVPAFTPPKIDTPVQSTAKTPGASGPSATARPGSPSAPSVHASSGGSGGSGWRVGTGSHGGDSPYKSSWATRLQGGSGAKGATGQCWAKASTPSKGAAAGNAWKTGGTGARPISD